MAYRTCRGSWSSRANQMGNLEAGKKVLIVDDEPDVRGMFERFLSRKGFLVTTAQNALEAVRICRRQPPDVILTDYTMPEMNGIELLREIRKFQPELPVILMSGTADMKTAVTALKEQAFDFLSKPVDSAELLAILGQALSRKRPEEEKVPDATRAIGPVVCIRSPETPEVSLLHFNRPLDEFSPRYFEEPLRRLALENELRSGIVLVLKNVEYINNVGLSYLLETIEKWKTHGHQVILTEMSSQLSKYLKTLGYLDYIPNTGSLADAIDAVR